MNRSAVLSMQMPDARRHIRIAWACIIVLVFYATALVAQVPGGTTSSGAGSRVTVTHVFGLQGVPNNAKGTLSIQNDVVHFQKGSNRAAQITIDSIQALSLGASDKQVGGVPMKVGKMAAPYGGGRVISLFAHKKYDTLTLEYQDANGGLHGAMFQMEKAQGQVLKDELIAKGAHVAQAENQAAVPAAAKSPENGVSGSAPWSVQVNRVDGGDVEIEPAFRIAIYENLLREMAKTDGFKQVFRAGDRKADDTPNVLILKTKVEKYTAGSETRRAVTTVTGATKLTVRTQLCTREGNVVMEREIQGNVRFIGDNLRATHNLARNVAKNIRGQLCPRFRLRLPTGVGYLLFRRPGPLITSKLPHAKERA